MDGCRIAQNRKRRLGIADGLLAKVVQLVVIEKAPVPEAIGFVEISGGVGVPVGNPFSGLSSRRCGP
jgi:hypothetical protein